MLMEPEMGIAAPPAAALMGFGLRPQPATPHWGVATLRFDSSAVGLTKKLPDVESWINVVPPAGVEPASAP